MFANRIFHQKWNKRNKIENRLDNPKMTNRLFQYITMDESTSIQLFKRITFNFYRGQDQQAERARLVNDFIQRKKEAEMNKMRGQEQLFGVSQFFYRKFCCAWIIYKMLMQFVCFVLDDTPQSTYTDPI